MAILQSQEPELRYLKRQNLEHEAKIVGNYYRDIIRSYGVDCIYNKIDTSELENFDGIVDQNTIIQKAYGYIPSPDYSIKANMVTFCEVDQDIFQLNKYGLNPQTDVNFYFDINDFACALATKCGQFKEYKIEEKEIVCEVPDCNDDVIWVEDQFHNKTSSYVSAEVFPYNLGLGYAENYECGILSGKLSVELSGYELDKETTVVCHPYEHTDFEVTFPANEHLYKSFQHKIKNDDYLDHMLLLTFKVSKVKTSNGTSTPTFKNILKGKIHGAVLFYDISKIGKYLEKIHPEVGDLVTIDFPDQNNREQYEITDCFDKSLTQDGISPLLHKYVWKCKAKRYVNCNEDVEEVNESNNKLEEKQQFTNDVNEEVVKTISKYDSGEDRVYGGYERDPFNEKDYDSQDVRNSSDQNPKSHDFISDGTALDIMTFECGSKLCTSGYDLIFIDVDEKATYVTLEENVVDRSLGALCESGLRWLKASKDYVTFINVSGEAVKIVEDEQATQGELEMCLNSLFDKAYDVGDINEKQDNFLKFKNSKTFMFATTHNLYCKLESNGKLYKIV